MSWEIPKSIYCLGNGILLYKFVLENLAIMFYDHCKFKDLRFIHKEKPIFDYIDVNVQKSN